VVKVNNRKVLNGVMEGWLAGDDKHNDAARPAAIDKIDRLA
jgi:hypothetical protein